MCLGLGVVLHVTGESRATELRALWSAGLAGAPPTELGRWWVSEVTTLLAWTSGLAVAVAVLTGTIGPVEPRAAEGLRSSPQRSAARGLLALGAPVVAVGLVVGVCAGAARGVDASTAGLDGLWLGWLRYMFFGTGGLLLATGLVDRWLGRRRLWRSLHRTVAEARAERRA